MSSKKAVYSEVRYTQYMTASLPRHSRTAGVIALIGAMTITTAAAQPLRPASRAKSRQKKIAIGRETIVEAQQRLIELGYWIPAPDGKWGEASRQGLIAFQKVEGRPRTGKLTMSELEALRDAKKPSPREHGAAHIEVDLTRQVLFMVDGDGRISQVLPVSTGNGKLFDNEGDMEPAITPAGRFRVNRKLPGWRTSPFGLLYYPNYIVGGIAIHGNPAVPTVPASHGCIRIPMFAAKEFSDITPIGTPVIVYESR